MHVTLNKMSHDMHSHSPGDPSHNHTPLYRIDSALVKLLKQMPPAHIEGELRSLSPENEGSLEWLEHFMKFMLHQLRTKMNFELIQSYMGLFLKVCARMAR